MSVGKIAVTTFNTIGQSQAGKTGFSRLSGVFRHGINYTTYSSMVSSAKNKVVGNLPSDLLKLIIKNNPSSKGESIKKVQQAFDEAAVVLTENEKLHGQALKRFSPTIENAAKVIEHIKTDKQTFYLDKIFTEKSTEVLLKAEEKLLSALKKTIPDVENVKISFIDQGTFALTYRCEIIGKNGQKIAADRVLKVFKDDTSNLTGTIFTKADDVLSKFSDKDIAAYAMSKGIPIDEQLSSNTKLAVNYFNDALKSDSKTATDMLHGAFAEANSAEYLRFMSGKQVYAQDGLVIPDMFSLGETKYSMSEFVNSSAMAKKEFDFGRVGLFHSDFVSGMNNGINGICIDIGGITPGLLKKAPELLSSLVSKDLYGKGAEIQKLMTRTTIVGDKFSTKLLKRYQACKTDSEKLKMLETFKQEAVRTKNMIDRKKYLDTIEEINAKYAPQIGIDITA